jgi:hypothetical protein
MWVIIGRILHRAGPFVILVGCVVSWTAAVGASVPFWVSTNATVVRQRRVETVRPSPDRAEPVVVTVVGHDCRGRDFDRSGFAATVGRERGIITTLHGVVGCRSVSAQRGAATTSSLLVTMVDVARDVAFLTSVDDSVAVLGPTPRPVDRSTAKPVDDRAVVVDLGQAPVSDLASIVGGDDLTAIRERRSPDPRIRVHAPAAAGAPDTLGTPVIDAAGTIVGVRNGITRAARPLSWVLPLDELNWMPPVQNETEMDRLATLTTLLW